jgi:hypothetical protein
MDEFNMSPKVTHGRSTLIKVLKPHLSLSRKEISKSHTMSVSE